MFVQFFTITGTDGINAADTHQKSVVFGGERT